MTVYSDKCKTMSINLATFSNSKPVCSNVVKCVRKSNLKDVDHLFTVRLVIRHTSRRCITVTNFPTLLVFRCKHGIKKSPIAFKKYFLSQPRLHILSSKHPYRLSRASHNLKYFLNSSKGNTF